MAFKDNLKRILQERGKKLTPFLVDLGYSPSKATAINQGQIPTEKILREFAEALNCSVSDFFADTPEIKKEPAAQGNGLSPKQIELINLILRLSDSEASVLLAALKAQTEYRKTQDNPGRN